MKSGITVKTILLFIGILLMVQLIFFNMVRSKNIAIAEKEGIRLRQVISELTIEKEFLLERQNELQDQYGHVVSSVPRRILDGYEDQEQMLAGFLDYIGALDIEGVEAKVTLKGEKRYTRKPVPVFKHDIMIDFSFQQLPDGEEFLSKVLGQDYYPLVVQRFDLHKTGRLKIIGKMDVTLHIPARMQKPLAEISVKEK